MSIEEIRQITTMLSGMGDQAFNGFLLYVGLDFVGYLFTWSLLFTLFIFAYKLIKKAIECDARGQAAIDFSLKVARSLGCVKNHYLTASEMEEVLEALKAIKEKADKA